MKKKTKIEYLVMRVSRDFMPKGVSGIMYVFTNKKKAQKFAKGADIVRVEKAEEKT